MDNQLERAVLSQIERDLEAALRMVSRDSELAARLFPLTGGLSAGTLHIRDLIALADLIGKERRWRSNPGLGEGE